MPGGLSQVERLKAVGRMLWSSAEVLLDWPVLAKWRGGGLACLLRGKLKIVGSLEVEN